MSREADAVAADVLAAGAGDGLAWARLVERFAPVLRSVSRRHGLGAHDQDEVAQRTWLALFKHIGRVEEPAAIGGWLVTTARREALRVLAESRRELPVPAIEEDAGGWAPGPEEAPAARERRERVLGAIARTSGRQRELLDALMAEPPLSYAEVGRRLDMPVGSIGPTRERCLARLRRDPLVAGLLEGEPPRRPARPERPVPDAI